MKKLLALTIGTSLLLTGCGSYAPADYGTPEAVALTNGAADSIMQQAASDLKAAKAAKSEWRFIDKAGGGSAQDLSKFMEIAEQKATDGDLEEAHRIAALVSKYATLGIAQGEKQKNAKPSYPN